MQTCMAGTEKWPKSANIASAPVPTLLKKDTQSRTFLLILTIELLYSG